MCSFELSEKTPLLLQKAYLGRQKNVKTYREFEAYAKRTNAMVKRVIRALSYLELLSLFALLASRSVPDSVELGWAETSEPGCHHPERLIWLVVTRRVLIYLKSMRMSRMLPAERHSITRPCKPHAVSIFNEGKRTIHITEN